MARLVATGFLRHLVVAVLLASTCTRTINAFVPCAGIGRSCRSATPSSRRSATTLPTPEESAQALTDYMAKSHEEKLRAIRDVELKKETEIQFLKKEIVALQQEQTPESTALTTSSTQPPPSQELAAKLLAYQQFMAKYMIKAQEDKLRAVRQAEAAVAKRYEEKLLLLTGSSTAATSSSSSSEQENVLETASPALLAENKLYLERSARVHAAAAAGKSRWGDLEAKRVQVGAVGKSVTSSGGSRRAAAPAAAPAPAVTVEVNGAVAAVNGADINGVVSTLSKVPPEVEAADRGLRADGGVGGLTLAERVALGAAAAAAATPPTAPTTTGSSGSTATLTAKLVSRNRQLFQQRSAMVSAAAAAGKTRWGEMEVKKVTTMLAALPKADKASSAQQDVVTSTTSLAPSSGDIPVPPEVEAADRGLRADGGVGGLTLAERVALGASAVVPAASTTSAAATPPTPKISRNRLLFEKRNAMVSAAAAAGKSRWGVLEVRKANQAAALLPENNQVTKVVAVVDPEQLAVVEKADRGLRADGGVGGPTLAERVHLGAQLLQT